MILGAGFPRGRLLCLLICFFVSFDHFVTRDLSQIDPGGGVLRLELFHEPVKDISDVATRGGGM